MRLLLFCGVLAIVPGVFCHPGSDPDIPDWGLPARLLPPGFRNRDRGLEEQGGGQAVRQGAVAVSGTPTIMISNVRNVFKVLLTFLSVFMQ